MQVLDELHVASDHSTLSLLLDVAALPSWTYTLLQAHKPLHSAIYNTTEPSPTELNITNFLDKISDSTRTYTLIFAEKQVHGDLESVLVTKIKKSISLLSGKDEITSPEDDVFVLVDVGSYGSPRSLLQVSGDANCTDLTMKVLHDLNDWSMRHRHTDECEGCETELAKALGVLVILGYSSALVAVLLGAAAFARRQLLKKRVSKGPYKVLLTATDFVFPQIADSRRVSRELFF